MILRPLKAIRAKCLDCCAGSSNEVKLCAMPDCPLYPYRKGHRPEKVPADAPDQDENPAGQEPERRRVEE